MCGRIVLKAPARQVAQEFELPVEPVLAARCNIAPGQTIAVVRAGPDRQRTCDALRWGLIPPWAADPREGDRLFNARSETAAGKPAFREAFLARRCLIPIDGFYEWRRPAPRIPYYFSAADGRLLALAGLWSRWLAADGAVHESCTILTAAAGPPVRPIHDRMPVILAGAQRQSWLTAGPDSAAKLRALQALLATAAAADPPLQAWPVSARINRTDAEGLELCRPSPEAWPRQLDLF